MARRKFNRTEEPFQMAPMIDMVFLLLVFFMTVSTLAKDARPELDLPRSATATIPETAPPKHIITVKQEQGDYAYFWSNQQISLDELGQRMLGIRASHSGQIVLRGEPAMPWEICRGLISVCRAAGFSDVVFATFEE